MLAILTIAAPPGRSGVSRERLLELLWPGVDEERGRAALSQALYAIRRDLGSDEAISGTTTLRLNPDVVGCDLWDFLQAVADGGDREAADLRTAPLLDGFDLPESSAFELWLEDQRLEIDRVWRAAVGRAAEGAERRGDWPAVVHWRRALANADPLSGRTAVALAQALTAAGESEAALRHLRVHMTLVRQELESEPADDVIQLAETLQRSGTSAAGAPATTSASRSAAAPATRAGTASPPSVAASPLPPAAAPPPDQPAHTPSQPVVPSRVIWRWGAAVFALVAIVATAAVLANRQPGFEALNAEAAPGDAVPVVAVGEIVGDSLGRAVASMLATNLARAAGVEVIATARMLELAAGGERRRGGEGAVGGARGRRHRPGGRDPRPRRCDLATGTATRVGRQRSRGAGHSPGRARDLRPG